MTIAVIGKETKPELAIVMAQDSHTRVGQMFGAKNTQLALQKKITFRDIHNARTLVPNRSS